jgi:hypothetical protein
MMTEQERARQQAPVRELRDSFVLLALMASSLSAYVGIGVLILRVFATR